MYLNKSTLLYVYVSFLLASRCSTFELATSYYGSYIKNILSVANKTLNEDTLVNPFVGKINRIFINRYYLSKTLLGIFS
jgi:hypothetical protein